MKKPPPTRIRALFFVDSTHDRYYPQYKQLGFWTDYYTKDPCKTLDEAKKVIDTDLGLYVTSVEIISYP